MIRTTMHFLKLGSLWTLALSVGCSVGPNYQRPATTMPAGYSGVSASRPAATQPAQLDRWWEMLKDPMLNSLVERASQTNLDLQLAEARIRQARAQRGVVAADLWPQLNAAGSYDYMGSSLNTREETAGAAGIGRQLRNTAASSALGTLQSNGAFGPGPLANAAVTTLRTGLAQNAPRSGSRVSHRGSNLFQAGFDASWELDLFGGIRREVEAADADIQAAEEARSDVLVSLRSEVARNYVEARVYQRRLTIARENIKTQQESLELTRDRFKAGLTSEVDVAQATAALATTQSQIPLLDSLWQQSAHRLAVLLGQEPAALLAELTREAPIPAVPPEIPAGLPSELLQRRPDIRQAERQLAAATARIGVATADLYPAFSLTGSVGSQSHDARLMLDRNSFLWSLGPAVRWPVFDAWRIRSNIEIQNAIQAQALTTYQQTILIALEEVENSLVAYRQEQVRHVSLAEAVNANRTALNLANDRYAKGIDDFLTVLESQRALYQTEDALIQSEGTVVSNLIALLKALGGGWQPTPTAP
ncbi:MAG TPA: efflux transporter outer membrane subunit [Phycisphaerae bacterium]|nr:efflux transporter outer membrane subunit [Phycisphaerae bacterium]HRY69017.1 efflux transporter outer membrane subunit [Phycisphaerae bacterium]HSA26009.1 efflux transporter outer membrane subunit [Phycisphaerae bacterium]